ncbi:unnamed protein product, partial [Laminaria digitata]
MSLAKRVEYARSVYSMTQLSKLTASWRFKRNQEEKNESSMLLQYFSGLSLYRFSLFFMSTTVDTVVVVGGVPHRCRVQDAPRAPKNTSVTSTTLRPPPLPRAWRAETNIFDIIVSPYKL